MSETCWDILGIMPTADESVIKKAYALKLKDNKPDKNPAGFRRVREAYEQALDERYFWYTDEDNVDGSEAIDEDIPSAHQGSTDLAQTFDDTELSDRFLQHYSPIDDTLNHDVPSDRLLIIDSLGNEYGAYYFNPTEQADLAGTLVLRQAQQQLIEWHKDWQDCLVNDSDTGEQSDDPSQQGPMLDSDHLSNKTADIRLTQCLTEQFEQLTEFPLDALEDYEKALIIFFDDHIKVYPNAYSLAIDYFDWQQFIDGWHYPDYPWSLLRDIEDGYTANIHFANKQRFLQYMAKTYPLLYQHWDFELPYSKAPSRWQFFCQLWFPIPAIVLNQQVNALQAELLSASASLAITNKELNYPQLVILKKRLSPLGFIRWTDFLFIALIVGALILNLELIFPYASALYDYIGVVTLISLAYLYWQLQLSYLADPEHHILSRGLRIGWGLVSLLSWILFADYIPIYPLYFDGYYFTHLAGCSTLLALTSFMQPAHLKHIIWVAALCLLLFMVILPVAAEASGGLDYMVLTKGSIPPLVWLAPMLPVLLVTLGSYAYPLRPLLIIGKHILTGFSLGSALLAFLILVSGSDILTSNYLLLTLLVSLFALVLLFMLMFISTNSFNEPDMF